MIATIIILALAFTWLMYETDFMRIRLESTEYQKAVKARVKADNTETENRIPYKPSEFTPLPMPEINGKLNIVCQIE